MIKKGESRRFISLLEVMVLGLILVDKIEKGKEGGKYERKER